MANHVWAYDFVFDSRASGQKLKCATVVDENTRECFAIDPAGSIRRRRVIEVVALITRYGTPTHLRSDNCPEFVSMAILQWLADSGINSALGDPYKPGQNGTNESFNGRFRDECRSVEWFRSRAGARVLIEAWRAHYNMVRPHSSLSNRTPHEFKTTLILDTHEGPWVQ